MNKDMTQKQLRIVFAAIVVIVASLIFWNIRTYNIHNLDTARANPTIVAFGDSLVAGKGATSGNDLISLLSTEIGRPIINLGKGGDTTADALMRIDRIFEHDPGTVIILLGGNDFLHRVPMDETFENLDKIVSAVQARGSAVLLLGVRGGLLYDSYDGRFARFAREHRTGYVPNVLDGLVGHSDLMSDPIHPNDAGYRIIADRVAPVLEEMLR